MQSELSNKTINLKARDGHLINVYCWDKVKNPRAILQVFHGMSEHAGRYNRFAKYLNSQGIVVFGDDHRGHGKTAAINGKLGSIGTNGFNNIVDDEYMITQILKEKYPNTPIYVFAHSFGSFVGQEYITRYSKDINGVILCGSAAQKGLKFKFAKTIAFIYMKVFGEEREARFLERLSFGSYNKRITPGDKTNWLSRDFEEIIKYATDSNCGFTCSADFYYYFCDGLTKLYKKNKLEIINKNLPIYIIAGEEDPVGEYGKNVKKLYDIYNNLSISDVKITLYKDARHELLNELNRDYVTKDILNWINEHLEHV